MEYEGKSLRPSKAKNKAVNLRFFQNEKQGPDCLGLFGRKEVLISFLINLRKLKLTLNKYLCDQ